MKKFLPILATLSTKILFLKVAYGARLGGRTPCPAGELCNPLGETSTVRELIELVVNWFVEIGGIIAVGMIIWGAFQMILAGGDPEKFSKGKKTVFYTVIGYAIILIGWGIESIITNFFSS